VTRGAAALAGRGAIDVGGALVGGIFKEDLLTPIIPLIFAVFKTAPGNLFFISSLGVAMFSLLLELVLVVPYTE
jgi:hypothetical protein